MRRTRYRDRVRKRSELVHFQEGESFQQRHARRLEFNLQAQEFVKEECILMGLSLKVTNDGHHWQFRAEGFSADWWPSSAKLVLNKQFSKGIHVHDHIVAMKEIRNHFHLKGASNGK